jgi:hypothetical protein
VIDTDESHRILKRRLAWLIGEWVGSDEECAKLPLVWQILVHLLGERGESSDMAVRLTAALAIKECVDVSGLWGLGLTVVVGNANRLLYAISPAFSRGIVSRDDGYCLHPGSSCWERLLLCRERSTLRPLLVS